MAEEKKTKKKKEQVSVKLPNARKSISRQKQMAQGKADLQGWWTFIGIAVAAGLILFILLGGINQRKFFETMKNIGVNIGEKVASWIHPDDIQVEDDGIYLRPGSGKKAEEEQEKQQENNNDNEEPILNENNNEPIIKENNDE